MTTTEQGMKIETSGRQIDITTNRASYWATTFNGRADVYLADGTTDNLVGRVEKTTFPNYRTGEPGAGRTEWVAYGAEGDNLWSYKTRQAAVERVVRHYES